MADFEVKIATEPSEIEEAQRLRFQVFNLELNKGLKFPMNAVWMSTNSIRFAIT